MVVDENTAAENVSDYEFFQKKSITFLVRKGKKISPQQPKLKETFYIEISLFKVFTSLVFI
jgi:hypothetical protein